MRVSHRPEATRGGAQAAPRIRGATKAMAETRRANITIEAAPDGLHIRVEYTAELASIPAAVERLKGLGILDLVQASRAPAPATNGTKPRAPRVQPTYDGNGDPCCPVHRKPLAEGRYGLFCPSRASGNEAANDKGYCNLKFAE
jgi:hypothetical protein